MKLSVVIAPDGAPSSAFVVWRGFHNIEKAHAFGYQGVELALGDDADVDESALLAMLARFECKVSCISTGLVFARRGLCLTHPDENIRREAFATFVRLTRLAGRLGCDVNIGRARGGVHPEQSLPQARGLFLEGMKKILVETPPNVRLLIEPVNRYEINFVNSLDDASSLIDELPKGRVKIMADLFHMNIEDDSIHGSLVRNAEHVGYIHVADSNRKAPGRGHTPFPDILSTLRAIGYDGWLGAEILPGDDPDASAREASRYLLTLLS